MKKLFFIAVLTTIFVVGCAGKSTYQPPEGCLNDEGKQKESVILKYVDHPNEVAIALKLATTTAASKVTPDHVKEMINVIEVAHTMLENNTYSGVAGFLLEQISMLRSEYSVQLMIITQYAQNMINIDLPINECDKVLLKKHFKEQVQLLKGML